MPSDPQTFALLVTLVLAAALLYSSVGHAGASGYLAAMALVVVAPATMKPSALAVNVVVAIAGTARWWSAGLVPWRLLWPLCITSAPTAFLGGYISLPATVYRSVLGALLLVAAVRLWLPTPRQYATAAPRPVVLAAVGATLGFLAGLTGIGGGVFLSPVLILTGWEEPRRTPGRPRRSSS